ncbi:MAG TPA: cytochrome b [Hyphomicrobiaceae bacterium]
MNEQIDAKSGAVEAYSAPARFFHWLTAVLVAIMVPVGLTMNYRGNTLNIWDDVTNHLYSTHKLVGFLLLWVVVVRIGYRLWHGAPPPEPTLEPWQRYGSAVVHYSLYALILIMPILGWLGVSLFPALEVFGAFSLPALAEPDQELSKQVLSAHKAVAFLLIALILGHAGMALFHHFVRKDNVLWRMLTSVGRR